MNVSESDGLDRNGLKVLDRNECLALLAGSDVGRVAVSMRALPVILPVTFTLLDEDVVFRTGVGTKLAAAAHQAVVAFEADHVNGRDVWSVCVTGMASILDGDDATRAEALPIPSVLPRLPDQFVRIRSEIVTGRRIPNGPP